MSVIELPAPTLGRWRQQWGVDSVSSDNRYTVSCDAHGRYACSCPAWKFQRAKLPNGHCKHIDVVLVYLSTRVETVTQTHSVTTEVESVRSMRSEAAKKAAATRRARKSESVTTTTTTTTTTFVAHIEDVQFTLERFRAAMDRGDYALIEQLRARLDAYRALSFESFNSIDAAISDAEVVAINKMKGGA